MKHLFFILFFSIIIKSISYGQNIHQRLDSLTMNFVKELQLENIDTICVYKDYCIGCGKFLKYQEDSITYYCFHDISIYIFWVNQGKTFINKKDNCFDYSTVEIGSTSLWNIFFTYENQIKMEKVKPFEYLVCKNKKKKVYSISIDHSRHLNFKIIVDKDIVTMNFDEFDLEKEDNGYLNINYSHNWNLKSKKIIDELKRLVSHIEDEKLFTKNRR